MTQLIGYPCAVCSRQSRGWAISAPGDISRVFTQFCSRDCMEIFMKRDPLTQDEKKAALAGGNEGGAFLDQIGKTDLATLDGDEWAMFCGLIFAGACDHLKAQANDEVPF